MASELAILGGTPVRERFPEPRPRLRRAEAAQAARVLREAEWSRCGDDWPLPALDELEAAWARAHGAAHAVAVSSGTAGLTLTLKALGLPPGDEVLIPAYGCPAVDAAVLAARLTPVHVEIDPATCGLHPAGAAAAVTPRTAALVAVHFAGLPAGLGSLRRLADRCGLALIEDACLAPGAAAEGVPAGASGRAGVFSLGVRKPVSAGEGGLVVTGDAALAAALRRMRSLGEDPASGELRLPAGNHRLTALQAAVALPQLRRLEQDRGRRERAARLLSAALRDTAFLSPLAAPAPGDRHAWAQFWIRCDERGAGVPREVLAAAVQAEGIPLFPGWPRPNYCLGVYTPGEAARWLREIGSGRSPEHYARSRCPEAERAAFEELLLLDFPLLDGEPRAVRDAAEALRRAAGALDSLRAVGRRGGIARRFLASRSGSG